jgi:hypothetical protein
MSFGLAVFGLFFVLVFMTGRQFVINCIFGMYLSLLFILNLPYLDYLTGSAGSRIGESIVELLVFAVMTAVTTWLVDRIMPDEFRENRFESVGRKVLLALVATTVIMAYSYHALPVTELLTPGTPLEYLFGREESFFVWLLVPLVIISVI